MLEVQQEGGLRDEQAGTRELGNRMLNIPCQGGAEPTEATMAAINLDVYAAEATAPPGP